VVTSQFVDLLDSLLRVVTPGTLVPFGTSEVGVCACLVCDFTEYGVFPDMDQNEKLSLRVNMNFVVIAPLGGLYAQNSTFTDNCNYKNSRRIIDQV
jgi:hypothetical protein